MLNAVSDGDLSNEKLREIALRLRSRMKDLNLNTTELARRCDAFAQESFTHGNCPNLTRERIAKILMNAQPRIGKGSAKVISQSEVLVLSNVLNIAPEWLANQTEAMLPAFWDIGADPNFAARLTHLLSYYEEVTNESLIWGENLLCSLLPPEFVHAYYENYFAEYDSIGLQEQKQLLVKICSSMGNARRKALFDNPAKRSYTVTHLIYQSELKKIVEGSDIYAGIIRPLRQRSLKGLAEFVSDKKYKINLIIVCDEKARHLKHLLRDYDRFSVNGEKFSLWSYHFGRLAWSEDEKVVRRHRKILEELMGHSLFRNSSETAKFILELCDELEKKKC